MSEMRTLDSTPRAAQAQPRRQLRLDTIIRLRWLAVLGQTAAVFVVAYELEFDVPVIPCLAVISFAAIVNVALHLAFPPIHRLAPQGAAALMALNIAELAALLFLTGGLQNPFAFLFLGPVLISATTLPPRLTLALGAFAVALSALLGFWHLPLPWANDEPLNLPPIYTLGVWLSICLAIGVTSLYAFQATEQARKLGDALAAAELVLEREQHLSQLDGLAAAAAHELGTPLSTISVIVKELERNAPPHSALAEELRAVREQANRCRDILGKLTQLPSDGGLDRLPITSLIEDVVAPHRHFGIAIHVATDPQSAAPEPILLRNPAILYGLGNILENAVDHAHTRVDMFATWSDSDIVLTISDDGPGIPPDILGRIGEPYLSRRGRKGATQHSGGHSGGLGLGLFIAKSFLERSEATVTFANRVFPAHGAVVRVHWYRNDLDNHHDLASIAPATPNDTAIGN